MNFKDAVLDVVKKFRKTSGAVRVVSNFDTDGITSAAIIVKALQKENRNFSLSIVKQLTEDVLKELSKEDYETFLILDMGSGSLDLINKYLKGKNVFVLDHHQVEDVRSDANILNPLLYGVEDYKEISAAGVCYFFAKALDEKNIDSAYLAVIGAIGDVQENKGFVGLNQEILKDAEGKLEIRNGLRMFGAQTRPLHKLLMFSTDPYIPGVSGSEIGALRFLESIGIKFREDGKFRKLIHLGIDEIKKLTSAIIIKRFDGKISDPMDVIGPVYLLREEEEGSPIKDAREFSTLLNASGRLGKPSIGLGVCLGSKKIKEKAVELLDEYRAEIVKSLNWFYDNRKDFGAGEIIIINAKENIKDTFIGVVASIIANSKIYEDGTLILAMAYTDENIKLSIRQVGMNTTDLKKFLSGFTEKVGGIAGGHVSAAGGFIPTEKEEEFISNIKNSFKELKLKQ